MELKIRFDVLSPRGFSLEQNHSTAAPTAEQSIMGILVTFDHGGDQTQRLACCKAVALSEHPATMDSWLRTSISSLSFKFIMLLSRFRCLHSGEALAVSFLRAHLFFWVAVNVHSLAQFSIELPFEKPGNGYHCNYTDSSLLKCT